MEEMIAPRSNQENQTEGATGDGYSESEREQLDTLIEGQQQQ
jgi:hypothetical protein